MCIIELVGSHVPIVLFCYIFLKNIITVTHMMKWYDEVPTDDAKI